MSGSISRFLYNSDDGTQYWVRMDKSNAILGGFDAPTNTTVAKQIPKGMKMRYVNWRSDDGLMSRKFYIGKADNAIFANGGRITVPTIEGDTKVERAGSVFSRRGEKNPLLVYVDTGITDTPPT